MKFTISREALLRPLTLVAGVVERRQTLPVLSNVLIQVEGDQVALTGTDLEVELVGRVALEDAAEPGEITVPARKLMDICKSLQPDALIDIRTGGLSGGAPAGAAAAGAGAGRGTDIRSTAVWTLGPDGQITASGQRFGPDRLPVLADALVAQGTRDVLIVVGQGARVRGGGTVTMGEQVAPRGRR